MIYQFTQNGLPPDCHAERSEASVTDSSLRLRMTEERSVIDEVAPSACERMTCSVNMYIITKKYPASESCIGFIIARCENRFELLKDLVRFFKEYMPRYGYKHLCTEDDDYKYYQTLNLPCIKRGFMGLHCNYGAPLKDVDV